MEIINTVPLSYFIDELMLLDGLEKPMAESYARTAIIDICTRTQILRRSFEVETIACANEYFIDIPPDERVVSIQEVCGYTVLKKEPCNFQNCHRNYVWFVPPDNIKVSPTPVNSGDRFRVVVSVTPKQDACGVDELIYENYRQVVIDKALSLLYLVKQARWYDANLARYHYQQYWNGMTQIAADRLLGTKRGRIRLTSGGLNGW